MNNRTFFYAFDTKCKVIDVQYLDSRDVSVKNILRIGRIMHAHCVPRVRSIWAVDGRPGLYSDYLEAVKSNDFVKHVEFMDMVSREGLLVSLHETDTIL